MAKGEGEVIQKIKEGNITLDVWENPGQKGGQTIKFLTFSISRSYFDKRDGKWHYSNSFGEEDLPAMQGVIDKYLLAANTVNNTE
jgi:hypothetical protein